MCHEFPFASHSLNAANRPARGTLRCRGSAAGDRPGAAVPARSPRNLPAGSDHCDLLQVFWCPFSAHGPSRYDLELHLRWRRSWEVGEVLSAPTQPPVVGSDGFVRTPMHLLLTIDSPEWDGGSGSWKP